MAIDDQVYTYVKSSGNHKLSGSPHPRLVEYNRLSFFWKEFGLNKFDLDSLPPEWKEEMYLVHMGIERVKKEYNTTNTASKPTGARGTIREKIL